MSNIFNKPQTSGKKKLLFTLLIAAVSVLFFAGIIAAYFSDYFQDIGNLTSDTFKINVTHSVFLNEAPTTLNEIELLNPGDVIVIKGTIENQSNQSAWVRETISFAPIDSELLPFLEIYDAEISQAALLGGGDFSQDRLAFSEGAASSASKVLNGAGENFITESGGGFNYVGEASYDYALTIYFSSAAGNQAQNKTATISFMVQALQFKNNNANVPSEASWAAVWQY